MCLWRRPERSKVLWSQLYPPEPCLRSPLPFVEGSSLLASSGVCSAIRSFSASAWCFKGRHTGLQRPSWLRHESGFSGSSGEIHNPRIYSPGFNGWNESEKNKHENQVTNVPSRDVAGLGTDPAEGTGRTPSTCWKSLCNSNCMAGCAEFV